MSRYQRSSASLQFAPRVPRPWVQALASALRLPLELIGFTPCPHPVSIAVRPPGIRPQLRARTAGRR